LAQKKGILFDKVSRLKKKKRKEKKRERGVFWALGYSYKFKFKGFRCTDSSYAFHFSSTSGPIKTLLKKTRRASGDPGCYK
jgi:hypothetical protein